MAHVHINIAQFVKLHPHAARLKKRVRTARGVKPSRMNELWYKNQLMVLVNLLRKSAERELIPALTSAAERQLTSDSVMGDAGFSIGPILGRMARSFGGIEVTARRIAALAVRRNLEEVDERLAASLKQSVGIDISFAFTQQPVAGVMQQATQANIDLITSIPAQYFDKLQDAIEKNFVAGVRPESLAKVVEHVGEVTASRAKLIARDQTSKMNSAFNEARQTSVGIEEYEWQTAGDERVRETHADNEGQIFRWDDPPDETGHPGHDVNCRCTALPHFDLDAMEESLFTDEEDPDNEESDTTDNAEEYGEET